MGRSKPFDKSIPTQRVLYDSEILPPVFSEADMTVTNLTTKQEDEFYSKDLNNRIKDNIKYIERMIKEGDLKRPESATSRINPSKPRVKRFNTELANKVPLSKEIEKKYKLHTILQRNKILCDRFKGMKGDNENKNHLNSNQIVYDNSKYIGKRNKVSVYLSEWVRFCVG